jgi:hypothetical protein
MARSHDAALAHLQRDALEHQDHMVVDDLDAVDVENDIAVGVHGLAFLYQSKELLHNPLDWRLPGKAATSSPAVDTVAV